MKRRYYIMVIMCALLFNVWSCNMNENDNNDNDDNKVTTKDVKNPISANKDSKMDKLPEFDFPVKEYNFGTVIQGEKVSYSFNFTNVGGSDLIINNVKASCGCTTPDWTKKPVAPGEKGFVEIIFDSHGRSGEQKKTVKIFANTQPKTTELRISCNIVTQ